jgi:hypothetical protein
MFFCGEQDVESGKTVEDEGIRLKDDFGRKFVANAGA